MQSVSLSSLRRAETALAVVIVDARREGYLACLADLEREIYSCSTLDELLRWVSEHQHDERGAQRAPDDEQQGGDGAAHGGAR